ncbi:hypothetical protein Dda3937_04622 [Dickeya dadantii 3937]|uniref:Uncharacterized protein n=1 Tax=Dickeya dadantii (strain 3937) TaxID=198628 RepID=E0SGW5_DICD3|nr:hypothetical protein Dda3937_04622 [Dickeya dadantii 3937]
MLPATTNSRGQAMIAVLYVFTQLFIHTVNKGKPPSCADLSLPVRGKRYYRLFTRLFPSTLYAVPLFNRLLRLLKGSDCRNANFPAFHAWSSWRTGFPGNFV